MNLNKFKKLTSLQKSVTSSCLDHLHECLDNLKVNTLSLKKDSLSAVSIYN